MAIEHEDNVGSFAQAEKPQQQQQQQKPAFGKVSFANLGTMLGSPLSRNPQSEVLAKLTKAMQEIFDSIEKTFKVTIVAVDRNQYSDLAYSAAVVCVQNPTDETAVSFHTLILEGSGEVLQPRPFVVNNKTIEIMHVTSEAYDKYMLNAIKDALGRQFPRGQYINASHCVVPRDFNIEDRNAVYAIAANATTAAYTTLATRSPGFQDLNLANVENDNSLALRTNFGRNEQYNAVNHPVRTDIIVDLVAVKQNSIADQSINAGAERQVPVSTVGGYADLVWNPVIDNVSPYAMIQDQAALYQKFSPRLVITKLEPSRLLTIPAQLLALVSFINLREDMAFVNAFRPKPISGNAIDMHDIGGVGYEVNFEKNPTGYGNRINTKQDSFRPEMLGQLVHSVFRPGLLISMDIPESGPDTWWCDHFLYSAIGRDEATKAIIAAAQCLTNGAFGNYFKGNRVLIDDNNRIHLGYYTDSNGVKRDIRDVDYLAVANLLGDKDPALVRDWSDTFNRTEYAIEQRLSARKQTIQGILPDAVFTGFGRRVTFTADFIDALMRGCADAGLKIRKPVNYLDQGIQNRANGAYLTAGLMVGAQQAGGVFTNDFGAMNPQFRNNVGFSRW